MEEPKPEIIKIIDKREVPSVDPGRIGKFTAIITYKIDEFRTYMAKMPDEDAGDPAKVKAAIKKDMAARAKIIGQEMEI